MKKALSSVFNGIRLKRNSDSVSGRDSTTSTLKEGEPLPPTNLFKTSDLVPTLKPLKEEAGDVAMKSASPSVYPVQELKTAKGFPSSSSSSQSQSVQSSASTKRSQFTHHFSSGSLTSSVDDTITSSSAQNLISSLSSQRNSLNSSSNHVVSGRKQRMISTFRSCDSIENKMEQDHLSSSQVMISEAEGNDYSGDLISSGDPIITFPTTTGTPPVGLKLDKFKNLTSTKTMSTANGLMAKKALMNMSEGAKFTSDDLDMEKATSVSAMKQKLESEAFQASKSQATRSDQRTVRMGDQLRSSASKKEESTARMITSGNGGDGSTSAEQELMNQVNEDIFMGPGRFHSEKNSSSQMSARIMSKSGNGFSSSTTTTSTSKSSSSTTSSSLLKNHLSGSFGNLLAESFDGSPLALNKSPTGNNLLGFGNSLLSLTGSSARFGSNEGFRLSICESEAMDCKMLDSEALKAEKKLLQVVDRIKKGPRDETIKSYVDLKDTLKKSWFMLGIERSNKLCDKLKSSGGLDLILEGITNEGDPDVQVMCIQVLQYGLSPANVSYLLAYSGIEKIVDFAISCADGSSSAHPIRAGIGIIAHLFMSNEETCKQLVMRGALDTVIKYCPKSIDMETQRNCAVALANLAVFGGQECHHFMVKAKVPEWLLYLGTSIDQGVVYNACHVMAILVSNKEIEAAVLKSTPLSFVEHFVSIHSPQEVSHNPLTKVYGQSKEWLKRYISVLDSDKEEAKALAAFHFAATAYIKKRTGDNGIFKDLMVTLIDPLKRVAACPHALASKYAAEALKMIGADVPHKLSQQVPLWDVADVKEWVKQIGFLDFAGSFSNSKVDGDLLLQLNESMLKDDIGMENGILRKRFMRELGHLKRITDYSSCDATNLVSLLDSISPMYVQYAYNLLNSGVDKEALESITEDQLLTECNIESSIHRWRILNSFRSGSSSDNNPYAQDDDVLDVFVSYRRSNGSQLASLLKVMLQMKGYSTFIDIERLEAGKFDSNLINSIKKTKHFILVLTPGALDRCIDDPECKDWVHREIVEALKVNCNIIPVVENFDWPEPECLPEDIRALCRFNGIRWIHEYQDACIDKLDRFIKGTIAPNELDMSVSPVHPQVQQSATSSSVTPMSPLSPVSPHLSRNLNKKL